jgi:hypothetical protein
MPIQSASDNQKVDYLWKKIVYGAAKTDISGNIDATNEPVASPLLIRGDKIWQQAGLIANVIPGSNSSVVTVYPTTLPVECISTAGIPTPTLTWQTGQTFWIPPEFGSTYQIKVYISPSGQAGNVLTKGTQVFATGSGSNDLWVFDYQAGILNFNSNNTPYSGASPISFTGNSVYISGAVYSGAFGFPSTANIGNLILGNITFTGNTISSNQINGNIMISAPGTGIVQFVGQDAIGIPAGDDSTRPANPEIGYLRFNTDRDAIEYWTGNVWEVPGEGYISSEIINPDGTGNTFVMTQVSTADAMLVSINGTIQQPYTAYNVNGYNIIFTEVPEVTDRIEIRHIALGSGVTVTSLVLGNISVSLDTANVNVVGNLHLSQPLSVQYGGTGGANANVALQNLLPTTTNYGYVLTTNGAGSYYWAEGTPGPAGTIDTTYETLAQNVNAYPYTINRTGSTITDVTYTVGGNTIVKEFTYNGSGQIESIAIYGTPLGSTIYTKNLTYSGTSVSSVSYSIL